MRQVMKKLSKYLILGLLYSNIYMLLELLYRGYTHYSMGILAFGAGLLIGSMNEVVPWRMPLILQSFVGACIATAGEYLFGILFNRDYSIWSYLDQPFNFQGQICLLFFFVWFGLSFVVIILDDYLRYWLFQEDKPKYRLK